MLRFAHLLAHVGVITEEMFAVGADRLEARMRAADQIELTHQRQGAIPATVHALFAQMLGDRPGSRRGRAPVARLAL